MNVESAQQIKQNQAPVNTSSNKNNPSESNFADELSKLKANDAENDKVPPKDEDVNNIKTESITNEEKISDETSAQEENVEDAINGIQGVVQQIQQSKKNNKNLGQIEENQDDLLQNNSILSDNNDKQEDDNLINNDVNIQELQDKFTPQMNAQMNFNSNGQPFSAFVEQTAQQQLSASETDIAEEKKILSTMDENIAIAKRNMLEQAKNRNVQNLDDNSGNVTPRVKTITNEDGIKKVDTKDNVTVETVVKYDNIIMNRNDVEFFTQLVENGSIEENLNVDKMNKSSQVSKTLADLIAKSMKDNQPIRIDFDNDISVIIKISKDGKISADFLPSSQIAEAYLKENLPILKQRFDDNNINYDELNQRKQQKQDNKEDRKKGRKDE